jgi:hypothetical protein
VETEQQCFKDLLGRVTHGDPRIHISAQEALRRPWFEDIAEIKASNLRSLGVTAAPRRASGGNYGYSELILNPLDCIVFSVTLRFDIAMLNFTLEL